MKEKERNLPREDIAINVLKQIKGVLDKHAEYWLDQGTLLGAVRDGKFIPWGGDIDLIAWRSEAAKIASAYRELIDRGFMGYSYNYRDWAEYYILKEGCHVDIVLYRLNNDKATCKEFITKKKTVIGYAIDHLLWVLSIPPYVELNH